MQALVDLFSRPSHTHRVLRHLQSAGSHTTSVDSLTRSEELSGSEELVHSLCGAAHVADLSHAQRLLSQNLVGIGTVQLVLCGARQIDVGFLFPRLLALEELSTLELLCIRCADVVTTGTQLQHVFYLLVVQSCRVVDVAVRSADGNHLGAQLGSLLCSTPSHIAET